MAKVLTSKEMGLPDKKPEAKKTQEKPAAKLKGKTVFQVRCEHVPQKGKSNVAYARPDGKTVQLELRDGAFRFPSKMPLNAARDLLRELVAAGFKDESRFVQEGKGAAKEAPPDDEGKEKEPEKEPGPTPDIPVFELVHPDNTTANPINGKFVLKIGGKKVKFDVVDGRVETDNQKEIDALIDAGFRPTWAPGSEEAKSEEA